MGCGWRRRAPGSSQARPCRRGRKAEQVWSSARSLQFEAAPIGASKSPGPARARAPFRTLDLLAVCLTWPQAGRLKSPRHPPPSAYRASVSSFTETRRKLHSMPTPRFRYRLGLNQPADSPTVRRVTEMAEAIGQQTDRQFRLDVFPESRLGPDPKMFADLRAGALEFYVAGATLGDLAPTSALPLLPFAFSDTRAVFAALDGSLGDQIRSELAQNGLHA